jgi:hypothetical protein
MTGPCQSHLGGEDCGAPSVTHVVAMCVHEHRREADLCAVHAASQAFCSACLAAPASHYCPLTKLTEEG